MTVNYFGSSGGQNSNSTASYTVIYKTATTYKVNITYSATTPPAPTEKFTAWVGTDGTVIAVMYSGLNMTGSMATSFFSGTVAPFMMEESFTSQQNVYTFSQYFHVTSQGTATFGPTTMTVTNYAANSLPLTFSECGTTATLTEYSLQLGSVPSSSVQLLTLMHLNGTFQTSSGSSSVNFTVRLLSLTLA
jgi:hypothetical protein